MAGGATPRGGGPQEPAVHQARLCRRAAGCTVLSTSCANIRDANQADADDDVDDDLGGVRVRVKVTVRVKVRVGVRVGACLGLGLGLELDYVEDGLVLVRRDDLLLELVR